MLYTKLGTISITKWARNPLCISQNSFIIWSYGKVPIYFYFVLLWSLLNKFKANTRIFFDVVSLPYVVLDLVYDISVLHTSTYTDDHICRHCVQIQRKLCSVCRIQ